MMGSNKHSGSATKFQGRHIVGALIVTGLFYVFAFLMIRFLFALTPSVWIGIFVIFDPWILIAFAIWFFVCRKILALFGWLAPGKALTMSLTAGLVAGAILLQYVPDPYAGGYTFPYITPFFHFFAFALLIFLPLCRNLGVKLK
jgi:hypothetical protein